MPELASLGLSIDTRPVLDGTKALDGLGDAANRVEPKIESATKAVDGLSNATANVWRRGADATKGIDALGDATARTGQRATVSNGQMSDTAKIMQAQAEQARATAQAQVALGGSTTQLTLGQQLFIDKLRDQAAVLGMSRSQLLAYQAAQMGVTAETSKLIAEIKKFEDGVKAAADAKAKAAQQSNHLTDALSLLAKGYAALKVAEYIKESALLAARYETLGVVMEVVGRNAGYTKTQMITATEAIARQGITMIESRESAVKLVQAHVDLKNATALARIAQDAAVIGHLNSSDAFDRLVNGISRGNVLILRNIGINVNLQTAYRQMAEELGKSTKELSENERVQARLNAVIARGADIAGTYEAAMGTASKQITSMQRYVSDLKTVIGETFNEVLTVSVMALTKHLKDANGEVSEMSRNGQLHEWGRSLAGVFIGVSDAIGNTATIMEKVGAFAAHQAAKGRINADFNKQANEAASKKGFFTIGTTAEGERLASARAAALAEEDADYAAHQAGLSAQFDKFGKAQSERDATITAKRKVEAEARLKVDVEYAAKSQALMIANAGKSLKIQQDAQVALANSVYVGTPTYRDTEGRDPKPKVDQAENTRMADQLARIQDSVNAEKSMIDQLSKIDDLYHKAGLMGDQKFYANKRAYADAAAAEEINGYTTQIAELRAHHSATAAEAEKHSKQINDILGKKAAAEQKASDQKTLLDIQEQLRQGGIVSGAEAASNKEIAAIDAQVAAVQLQIRTYGLLPAAKTAVAIADLEEQAAALAGFENSEKTIAQINQKIEALGRLRDAQGIATKQEQGSDVAKAKELLDILTAVDAAAQSAAAGMADSFGKVGTAIGGLTTALTGYERTQAAIAAQLAASTKDAGGDTTKIAKANAAAQQQGAQAQIKSYGDMAHAAKGFFKENSTGYKVLEGAEKAFRAYEMAMALESMVKKIFFKEGEVAANVALNGTKLAGEAGASAASVGLAGTEASAWGITAVVKALASLPFPFNLAAGAATLAAVVAIGAKMMGGGGGGSSVSVSEQRQTAQGTGSVFGDSTAKSDSIARSLELAAANSSIELTHTAGMLMSLRNIESSLGGLGNLLIRNSGLTGAVAPDIKGSAQNVGDFFGQFSFADKILGGVVGKALGAIFGGKVSVQDTGVIVDRTSLSGVYSGGVNSSQYTDTKKSGGVFHSDKYGTSLAGLGAEANDQFAKVIVGLAGGVAEAGKLLGVGGDAFTQHLNSFVVDIGKISLKGLKGEEIQAQLEAVFSKLGDDMAQFAVGGLDQFQQVGEGYLETLTRIAVNYANLDSILASTGTTFGATGMSSIAARERLLELAGGIDELASKSTSFADNFLTEAERLAPVQKYVTEQLGAMGLAGLDTRDKFKATVLGLANSGALATEAGAKQYAGLLDLADAFAKTHAATEDLTKSEQAIADERRDLQQQLNELTMTSVQLLALQRAGIADSNKALFDQIQAAKSVVTAKDVLSAAYDKESSALKTAAERMRAFQASTLSFADSLKLGSLSTLNPVEKAAEAQRQYEATLAKAKTGDTAAQSALQAAATAYLTADQVIKSSTDAYAADAARVQADMAALAAIAGGQATDAEKQLVALDKQVGALIDINVSIKDGALTVAQAIANLAGLGYTGLAGVDGSHAGGLARVPFDGYRAELHRDEVVVDAPAAAAMRRYFGGAPSQGGGNTDALVSEIKALREEVKGLRADQAKQTGDLIATNYDATDRAAGKAADGAKDAAKATVWAQQSKATIE